MSAYRLRRWPSINPTLGKRFVSLYKETTHIMLAELWAYVVSTVPQLDQHCSGIIVT